MAKLALINRDLKRARTVAKFAEKRAALKAVINDATRSIEERMEARQQLQLLPSRRQSVPLAQSLRFDGSSPWYVPQVRLGSYQDS